METTFHCLQNSHVTLYIACQPPPQRERRRRIISARCLYVYISRSLHSPLAISYERRARFAICQNIYVGMQTIGSKHRKRPQHTDLQIFRLLQTEYVHGFRIARAAQVIAVHAEGHAANGNATFEAATELVQLHAVRHVEHTDHGALFTSRRYFHAVVTEGQRCQRTFVRGDHHSGSLQQQRVREDLRGGAGDTTVRA